MAYLSLPIETSFAQLLAQAVANIKARRPGYRFDTASLDAAILEELVRIQQETRVVASTVSDALFDWDSESFYGRARNPAVPASVDVTITAIDTAGHTIPAGSLAGFDTGDDRLLAFTLLEDLVIPPLSSSGTATMIAVLSGQQGNQLGPGPMRLIQMPSIVATVVADTASTGGTDIETDESYRSRMAELRTITTDKPVGAPDFAIIAKQWEGIARATWIDNYDADLALADQEGHITIPVVDADGADVDEPTRLELAAWFENPDNRHLHVVTHVVNPTRQAVTVDFTAVAMPDADPADVQARAIAAVAAYLSPAVWGSAADDPFAWRLVDTIRYLEVAAVLDRVDGLDYITALTLDAGTADVTLTGLAVLPAATVNGTVSAP